MSNHQMLAVPTNVITGALGVGKTTFIKQLLARKPADERWAVLVNEFGEIGIDGALLSAMRNENVYIKEVPGGCMCCASGLTMQIALNRLLKQANPHRLIIEPTGLGHPTEVLATLSAPHYREVLDIRATFTLIDGRKVASKKWREHPTFREQLTVADHIVATKVECYDADELTDLNLFLTQLNLSHHQVLCEKGSVIDLALLDDKSAFKSSVEPQQHNSNKVPVDLAVQLAQAGSVRVKNQGAGYYSFGWAFVASRCFDFDRVLVELQKASVVRLKAVMITDKGIFSFNAVDNDIEFVEIEESEDSRLEFICANSDDANALAQHFEQTLFGE